MNTWTSLWWWTRWVRRACRVGLETRPFQEPPCSQYFPPECDRLPAIGFRRCLNLRIADLGCAGREAIGSIIRRCTAGQKFNGWEKPARATILFNRSSIKWPSYKFTDAVQLREQMLLKTDSPVKIR